MDYLAIIQARMGASRLPGKVLLPLAGKPVIEHVYKRVTQSPFIEETLVATSIEKNNIPLVKVCANLGIRLFIGSENDVLDRFYQASKLFNTKNIIRITADCPLHDTSVIDKVISLHKSAETDYTSNIDPPSFPDGLDVEIFTFNSLKDAWENANLKSEREHVTPYIRKNNVLKSANYENHRNLSDKRWTLDEPEDYKFINQIYTDLYSGNSLFGIDEVLKYLHNNPDIELLNKQFKRNEGYEKSIKNDKKVK